MDVVIDLYDWPILAYISNKNFFGFVLCVVCFYFWSFEYIYFALLVSFSPLCSLCYLKK